MTKGQRSWWVDWLSAVVVVQLFLKLYLCQVKSDFYETWYDWYESKELQSNRADFEYLHEISLLGLIRLIRSYLSREAVVSVQIEAVR